MRGANVTFALLAEGAWAEKGRMGWFGMAADEKDQEDWNDFWWRIVERAPDDTLFTIVDCHI